MSVQNEWLEQWSMFRDEEESLFHEWIAPARLEQWEGKDVLECGCGGGLHTGMLAEVARHVTAVDLNTIELARERNRGHRNVSFERADLGTLDLGRQFDVVVCVGVLHHTDDPDATFQRLYMHVRPGGQLVLWVYSAEGNALVRLGVEPLRKLLLQNLPRSAVRRAAEIITTALYVPVHTIYRLPGLSFLPYYEYFARFRTLSWRRNVLNVFDKLNAPQTHFISREQCERWMSSERFVPGSVVIRPHRGVSYTLIGTRR